MWESQGGFLLQQTLMWKMSRYLSTGASRGGEWFSDCNSLEWKVSKDDLQHHWHKIKACHAAGNHVHTADRSRPTKGGRAHTHVHGNRRYLRTLRYSGMLMCTRLGHRSSLPSSNDLFSWNFRIWLCSGNKEGGNLLSQQLEPAWSLAAAPASHWWKRALPKA